MKKTIFLLAAAALCGTASATILRVNNVASVGAPYTSLGTAIIEATEGDTIMVDGSSTSYGSITVSKRLVIMGPGYLRTENGVIAEGASSAMTGSITFNSASTGSIMQGMDVTGDIDVSTANISITRCRIRSNIYLRNAAANAVIHQNFFSDAGCINWFAGSAASTSPHGTQITNNIFNVGVHEGTKRAIVRYIIDGYIAYNTFTPFNEMGNYDELTNCTVEHNIFSGSEATITGCVFTDNYWNGYTIGTYDGCTTDKEMTEKVLSTDVQAEIAAKNAGAFNGDDPYVISGLPAGPVIEDITVPASVEKGQPLNITIKLGIQK